MHIFPIYLMVFFITLIIINYILSKYKVLIDNPELSYHKQRHEKIIPLSGGIFFIFSYVIFSLSGNLQINELIYLIPFFIIGFIADITKKFTPKLRLILQIFFIIIIISFLNIKIYSIDLFFFDNFLKNNIFNFLFVSFCLVTVLNGHNFMDGLNGFVSGNFLLISISIFFIITINDLDLGNNIINKLHFIICISLIFFILNLFGHCFFGDNGIYIFSIFFSLLIINFIEKSSNQVSPLIAASFLWYPAYENLFTIVRRLRKKKIISNPDNLHLHALISKFFKKSLKNKKIKLLEYNSISGLIINILLLPNFLLSIMWYQNSIKLLFLIVIQIILYMILYLTLEKEIR